MRCLLILVLGIVAGALPAPAATLRVPAEYPTINAALDASVPGDTVLVAPGTYSAYETRLDPYTGALISSVAFLAGGVVLKSEGGAEVTTLTMDATVGFPHILKYDTDDGEVEVIGFTFAGTLDHILAMDLGQASRTSVRSCIFEGIGNGGSGQAGIWFNTTDVDVFDCVFRDIDGGHGAAIVGVDARLLVEDCYFENVRSGVIRLYRNFDERARELTIRRCTFRNNEQLVQGSNVSGGSLDSGLIEDCIFEGNLALSGTAAGARLSAYGGAAIIRNCLFAHNVAGASGGAAVYSTSHAELSHCTFYDNSRVFSWWGSAAELEGEATVVLQNNIFAHSGPSSAVHLVDPQDVDVLIKGCNIYWDNEGTHVSGFEMDSTSMIADPMFCDPEKGVFTVDAPSPCLPENSNGCGLIGMYKQGCTTVSVDPNVDLKSWGRLKAGFRSEEDER